MRFREKNKFNYSIFFSLESTDERTLTLKKFHWPSLYSPNPREKSFFLNFFKQSEFEKKSNSIIRFFSHWNQEISEQWCWKNSIDLCCILLIRAKKFLFYQNFSTNEILRKNQIQLFDFFVIRIERRANSDAEKILLNFVVFSKSAGEIFFIKIFQPMRFWEKIKFNSSIFLSLESRDERTLMLKKLHWPSLYSPNLREKIFFSENFSTNEISRKNQIHFFDFFLIGIEGSVNSDAEKILLTFVAFSKSARKNFFFIKIFRPMRFREKIKFNSSIFSSLESRGQWTLMLKKFNWPLLYCRNSREKFFFYQIFSTNQNSRKNEIQLFDFLSLESRDEWTVMLKKFHWPLLYLPNRWEKNFFLWKFFNQCDFEKKSNSILRFFSHWNRGISEQWC